MKWLKRLQMMRISKIVIAVSLALSVIFAGFTIYGNKVGNFIINVSNDGAHIAATMKEDLVRSVLPPVRFGTGRAGRHHI